MVSFTSSSAPALIHAHFSRSINDLPFWLSLADRQGDPILELGCGSGRILLPLARAGHRIFGIDNQAELLDFLLQQASPEEKENSQIILGDIHDLDNLIPVGLQFSLIISPCNTFCSFPPKSRKKILSAIASRLTRRGCFAAALPNPALLWQYPHQAEAEVEDIFPHPLSGNPVQVSSAWRRTSRRFILRWIYDHLLPNGEVERFEICTTQYFSSLQGYCEELIGAGLTKIRAYGDFDGSAYCEESPELILIASP